MFRSLLLISILFCLTQIVTAQTGAQLTGTIHTASEPAVGSTVQLQNSRWHTVADSSGYFALFDIAPGRYQLEVTRAGSEPQRQWIELKPDDSLALDIILEVATNSLNEVVITGTLKPIQRLQSPVAVEVYTLQFFRKNPAPSLFESLGQVNGVRPQINCSVCNTGDIHINGLEGPYTMVTLDGMPIVGSLSSVYGLFGIPSQLLEKVEVIKGPASGLYGSEAIGGLINIITKDPEKAPRLSLNVMSTSWLEHSLDAGYTWQGKKFRSLLGLHYFNYQHPIDNNADGFTDVTQQHRVSLFNNWQWQRKQHRVASIAARYYYEDRWGGDTRWQKSLRGGDSLYGESIYTARWEVIGRYQLPVQTPLFFSFSATAHHQNAAYGTVPYLADQRIGFLQATWTPQVVSAHSVLAGMAIRYSYYDDNSVATQEPITGGNRPEKYWTPGIFVQDDWQLSNRHELLTGLRYDYHPVHGSILTPRIAYKWSLGDRQVLRLNAGTGFRVVNLFTEEHAALTGSREVVVQETLKPERSINANLNYLHRLGSAARSLTLDVSAWYTHFYNQILADYDTDPQKIRYNNLNGYALSRGLSLNLEGSWQHRLKGTVGITWQEVTRVEKAQDKILRIRPVLTEQWSGTWTLSYSLPLAGLSFDYTGTVYGPMRLPLLSSLDPRQPYSPVWSLQNLQVTKWVSKSLELFGGVKNLLNWTPARNNPFLIARSHDPFDKQVMYTGSGTIQTTPENPYGLSFDPSYVYAPNQGRRVFLGLRFTHK